MNKELIKSLAHFHLADSKQKAIRTKLESVKFQNFKIQKYTNEFWTSKQRQANALHEISYRACYKPQLPRFFIERLTQKGDRVYDPFSGRGTTVIEAGLLERQIIGNDVNPLSKILTKPRFMVPDLDELACYLDTIGMNEVETAELDLSMFFHPKTESELISLKNYILKRESQNTLNHFDHWIRMVASNRLTGHSKGFFSVYTLPPNQAVSASRQIQLNEKQKQKPEYRDVKKLILKKSKSLMKDLTFSQRQSLRKAGETAIFLTRDARETKRIKDTSIHLTVTSPPFLDIVQYASDNWLRCWFNGIDEKSVKISMAKTVEQWSEIMFDVLKELYRITVKGGYVAFEVGEIKNGKIKLDEIVVPLGVRAGFDIECIVINEQNFTKTSNIWGVKNNTKGTNSNRIVIFKK